MKLTTIDYFAMYLVFQFSHFKLLEALIPFSLCQLTKKHFVFYTNQQFKVGMNVIRVISNYKTYRLVDTTGARKDWESSNSVLSPLDGEVRIVKN